MSVNIPPCSDDAFLVPLKLHFGSSPSSSPSVLWAVDFQPPNWQFDNYVPPLNTEQHNRIELLAKEKGAQGICRRDGGLFAAFSSEEIAENVYGKEIFGDAFAVRTMQYLRGEVDTEEFLADVADASKNDIAEASIVLLGGMKSERPSSKKADLYPLSVFKPEIDERKHDSLLHSLFIMIGENPLDDKNWAKLALSYFFSGKATEAVTAAKWAVALNPADSANWKALLLVFSASYLAEDRDARFWIERAMAQLEEMDSEELEAVNLPRRILNYVRGEETINSEAFLAQVAKASEEDRAAVSGLLLQEVQITLETRRHLDLFNESAMHKLTIPLLKGRLNEAKPWIHVAFALSSNGMHALAVMCARWAVALEPATEQRWEDLAAILFKQYDEEGGSEVLHNREQEARTKAQEIRDKASPKPAKTSTDDTEGSSTPPVASEGPQSTPAPEGGSRTMADVGGFDPSEQDLFSTTSTESAAFLYSETNTTDPNVGIQTVQGSGATTLGLPMWFAVPAAARSAGIAAH